MVAHVVLGVDSAATEMLAIRVMDIADVAVLKALKVTSVMVKRLNSIILI